MTDIHVYLAGPTVFLPNAVEIGQAKKDILSKHGLQGHFPFDNEIDFTAFATKRQTGLHIGKMNYLMMQRCDTVIADLTPYHGPSADVGTFGECLFMYGGGKMINGYSNDNRSFSERVSQDYYKGNFTRNANDMLIGGDGLTIEDFDLFDNLMVVEAIEDSKGVFMSTSVPKAVRYTDLSCFEAVAKAVVAKFQCRL